MNARKLLNAAGCDMKVLCQRNWYEFEQTDVEGIRFCKHCKKSVFYTQTPAELRKAAEKGLCVYVVPDSAADKLDDLEQIGVLFDVSRERIRQIEAKTLKRMRGPMGIPILRTIPENELKKMFDDADKIDKK